MLYSERSALIVGAGAVGAVLGAALLAAGWHVSYRIRPETFLGYRRLGLLVRDNLGKESRIDGEHFICAGVAPRSHSLVLVCTKMPDLHATLDNLAADDDGERVYITVQNGLAAPEMAAALFGHRRVLAGAAVVNAYRVGLGEIELQSAVRRLALAPLRVTDAAMASRVAQQLRSAGIDAPVAENANSLLWKKFVGVEPLATACAMTGMNLGEVRRAPDGLVLLRGLFEETFSVGRAIGAPLDDQLYVRRWRSYFEGPPEMRPSLGPDLDGHRANELNWLTGTVVMLSERAKVSTPLHQRALKTLTAKLPSDLLPAVA